MEQTKNTPRDFFLYLLSSVTLYYSAVWLITLWYQYINHWFPEPNQYAGASEGISSLMRWALASLIIVFPVYIIVTHFLNKDMDKHPEKREMRIRKWLIYITLFIAAITIIVDLVALVFNLLDGDFTARFLLKVLSVFIVSGMVFGYYFYEIRRDNGKTAPARGLFRWISVALVLVSVIGAFFIVGSPAENRARRYDNQRIGDLQSIQWQVVNYWQAKQILPASLSDIQDPISNFIPAKDPETGASYEYSAIGKQSFELCATFSLVGDSLNSNIVYPTKPMAVTSDRGTPISDNWKHPTGHACFPRTIDSELYPPYSNVK